MGSGFFTDDYLFSFFLGITTVIGVFLAFIWRWDAPEGSLYRNHFDNQIKLFFKVLFFIVFCSLLMIFIGFLLFRYCDYRFDWGFAMWSMILIPSTYVFIMSAIGLVKLFGKKPYNVPVPKAAE
jgi:uncharacterized membrane protein